MEKTSDLSSQSEPLAFAPAPAFAALVPQTRIKEFVRRPAKGWMDCNPRAAARPDDTLIGWQAP